MALEIVKYVEAFESDRFIFLTYLISKHADKFSRKDSDIQCSLAHAPFHNSRARLSIHFF